MNEERKAYWKDDLKLEGSKGDIETLVLYLPDSTFSYLEMRYTNGASSTIFKGDRDDVFWKNSQGVFFSIKSIFKAMTDLD